MRWITVALLAAVSTELAAQPCPGFGPPAVFFTQTTDPHSTVAADFNGDGHLDLASANGGTGTVTIMLGGGTGSFAPPVSFAAGSFPWSIVTADFDENGTADLAVVNRNTLSFTILLGTGTGSFSPPISFAAGSAPLGLATGDFNEDGNVDVAVTTSSGVQIFLGNGAGSFGAPLTFPAGDTPWAITVADLNGDMNLDLAVTNPFTTRISVLLGSGTGTFSSPASFLTGGNDPRSITSGDFDFDGDVDLAVANEQSGTIAILLNAGNGVFAPPQVMTTRAPGDVNPNQTYPGSIVAADLTGDGTLDLIVSNFGRGNVVLFVGTGSGTFTLLAPVGNFTLGAAVDVIVADFDEDGSPDLAVTSILPGAIRILLNRCAVVTVPTLGPLALLALSVMITIAGITVLRRT
jgi:hypothetical protein